MGLVAELGHDLQHPCARHDDKPIADAVQRVAGQHGVPMAQVALAQVLHNPVISAPIVGATKPHHLADAAAALGIILTDDGIGALEEGYTARRPTGY
jgi:1-deoxyxylulose-5-phosphate synthase